MAQGLESQMVGDDPGQDLTTVNVAMQKQQLIESEMTAAPPDPIGRTTQTVGEKEGSLPIPQRCRRPEDVDCRAEAHKAEELGENLFDCHRLQKKNQSLRTEIENHEPWVQKICHSGKELIDTGHENSAMFELKTNELLNAWKELLDAVEERQRKLAESENAHHVEKC